MTMTEGELSVLQRHLGMAKHYLEFGSGASTVSAVEYQNIERIMSIESSQVWLDELVAKHPPLQAASEAGRLSLQAVDIGPTRKWGKPRTDEMRHNWPAYSGIAFEGDTEFDLVLVDGRFRVACALRALMDGDGDKFVIIHDFWNRPAYHVVLQHADIVERADTMVVLKPKANPDTAAMQALYAEYQYEPCDKELLQRLVFLWTNSWIGRRL